MGDDIPASRWNSNETLDEAGYQHMLDLLEQGQNVDRVDHGSVSPARPPPSLLDAFSLRGTAEQSTMDALPDILGHLISFDEIAQERHSDDASLDATTEVDSQEYSDQVTTSHSGNALMLEGCVEPEDVPGASSLPRQGVDNWWEGSYSHDSPTPVSLPYNHSPSRIASPHCGRDEHMYDQAGFAGGLGFGDHGMTRPISTSTHASLPSIAPFAAPMSSSSPVWCTTTACEIAPQLDAIVLRRAASCADRLSKRTSALSTLPNPAIVCHDQSPHLLPPLLLVQAPNVPVHSIGLSIASTPDIPTMPETARSQASFQTRALRSLNPFQRTTASSLAGAMFEMISPRCRSSPPLTTDKRSSSLHLVLSPSPRFRRPVASCSHAERTVVRSVSDRSISASGSVSVVQGRSAPYGSRAAAVGLMVRTSRSTSHALPEWKPEWTEFALQTFVGIERTVLVIKPEWDDETLLRKLKKTYRKKRGWLSWCCIRTIVKVWAQDDIVYPEHVNQSATTERCIQRMRHYLDHPDESKGRHEFMEALTMDERHGIEYVERYKAAWFYCAAFGAVVVFSLTPSVIYTVLKDDLVGGFTIGVFLLTCLLALLTVASICMPAFK